MKIFKDDFKILVNLLMAIEVISDVIKLSSIAARIVWMAFTIFPYDSLKQRHKEENFIQ